jgi:hypothetical protein
MSALLWEFIALLYAPLGAYGALVEGSTARAARCGAARNVLVA